MNLSTFIVGMGIAIAALSCSAADYQGYSGTTTNSTPAQTPSSESLMPNPTATSGPASANPPVTTAPPITSGTTTSPPVTAPDNTEINRRDNATGALTSQDQSNAAEDRRIASSIRKEIMASNMSTLAKNVKVITVNGTVTLRGPVNTAAEKEKIEQLAAAVAGVRKVDDLIDIKSVSTSHYPTH